MPLAVTHVLLTIISIDLYRDYLAKNKKYFSLHTVLLGGIAGLLPDIDIPLGWILGKFGITLIHGTITHALWFSLVFLIVGFIYQNRKDPKKATLFYVISFGVFFHLFLDWFLGGGHGGVPWFYPLSSQSYLLGIVTNSGIRNLAQGIDALILILWLWHEEVKHKISDFI